MIINVKTIPNANQSSIEKISDERYKIYVKSPPKNKKANIDLANLLAKYFNVPAKSIKIKNPASRKKIVEIDI